VLVSHGPGILVLPTDGPVLVRAMRPFKRTAAKDRFGYIAFEVKFVREGAGAGVAAVSIPYLSQVAYDAASGLGAAIAAAAPAMVTVADQPEFVAAAAASEAQGAAAAVDAVRTSYPVTAVASQTAAGQVQQIIAAAPLLLDPDGADDVDATELSDFALGMGLISSAAETPPPNGPNALAAGFVATIGGMGDGLPAAQAQDAFASLADAFAPLPPSDQPPLSANAATAAANVGGVLQMARLAALAAWANAVIGRTYTDRPSAVTARAEVAERFERELNACPGARFAALYVAIETLQDAVVQYLTQLMTNLAPVIEVESPVMLPSLVAAWKLYQDPTRAVDLVLRNEVRHPSFMPRQFAALAPGYAASGLPTNWLAPPL
jgi:prophage DNA circulation protein